MWNTITSAIASAVQQRSSRFSLINTRAIDETAIRSSLLPRRDRSNLLSTFFFLKARGAHTTPFKLRAGAPHASIRTFPPSLSASFISRTARFLSDKPSLVLNYSPGAHAGAPLTRDATIYGAYVKEAGLTAAT
jgi:hypothetical protein